MVNVYQQVNGSAHCAVLCHGRTDTTWTTTQMNLKTFQEGERPVGRLSCMVLCKWSSRKGRPSFWRGKAHRDFLRLEWEDWLGRDGRELLGVMVMRCDLDCGGGYTCVWIYHNSLNSIISVLNDAFYEIYKLYFTKKFEILCLGVWTTTTKC